VEDKTGRGLLESTHNPRLIQDLLIPESILNNETAYKHGMATRTCTNYLKKKG